MGCVMVALSNKNLMGIVSRKIRSAMHTVRAERFYVLDSEPALVTPRIPCRFECITRHDATIDRTLTQIKGFEVNWKRRFDMAHRCYLTICEGRPVGFGWVSMGSWHLGLDQPIGPLAPDVAYIYDEITCDGFRGNKLAPARLSHIAGDMAAAGYGRSCMLIADDNFASQKSALAAGYRRTESIVRMHRYALRIRFPEGAPPREIQPDAYSDYFATATAWYVLGRS